MPRNGGNRLRTTNGKATSVWATGTSHQEARRLSGGSSRAMIKPKPSVTAEVDSGSMERRFCSSLTEAEMSSGVRKGFGITGMQAKTFIAHYHDLVTLLAGYYLIDPECYGADLLSTWPEVGTGARLILDTYRLEAVRILSMGSDDAFALLGLDLEQVGPEIGPDQSSLIAALRAIHVQRLTNLMR